MLYLLILDGADAKTATPVLATQDAAIIDFVRTRLSERLVGEPFKDSPRRLSLIPISAPAGDEK